jgi:hypothetical protein
MSENKKKKVIELKDEEVEKVSGGGGTYRMYHCSCGHYTVYPLNSTSTYCEQCHVTGPAETPQNPHGR